MLLAIMDGNGQANKIRQNGGTTRPGFDRALVTRRARRLYLFDQVVVYEGTLFD
jgi:hypothetical protein